MLLATVCLCIALLIFLVVKCKLHPFISLLLVSIAMGVLAGMPSAKIAESIQTGMGNTLGFVAVVLGLGTVLGKIMEETGIARQVADALARLFGRERIHWAMMVIGFIVGLPVFFQVGFVLLMPLVLSLARETKTHLLVAALPMLASLSVVHGLVPPHPAAMATVGILKADVGKTILASFIVGIPIVILTGPMFVAMFRSRIERVTIAQNVFSGIAAIEPSVERPSPFRTATSTLVVFAPVLLIVLGSVVPYLWPSEDTMTSTITLLGTPTAALLVSVMIPLALPRRVQGIGWGELAKYANDSLPSIAGVLLIIGAGGAFSQVLKDSGVSNEVAAFAHETAMNPILLGWLVAAAIRIATGSATVAMVTAAGVVGPLVAESTIAPELMVLAIGSGSLILSHVNDAGFWLVKEYLGLTVRDTLLTWTVVETLISILGLIFTFALSLYW